MKRRSEGCSDLQSLSNATAYSKKYENISQTHSYYLDRRGRDNGNQKAVTSHKKAKKAVEARNNKHSTPLKDSKVRLDFNAQSAKKKLAKGMSAKRREAINFLYIHVQRTRRCRVISLRYYGPVEYT